MDGYKPTEQIIHVVKMARVLASVNQGVGNCLILANLSFFVSSEASVYYHSRIGLFIKMVSQ